MFVCLLRSVHGYPLRAEGLLREDGLYTWLSSLVMYREDTGVVVGSMPYSSFTESTIKVLRKRGFTKTKRGWRILTVDLGEFGD